MLFQVSSQLEAMNSRTDGTYKLVFGTQELTAKEALQLFNLIHKQGWLLFKDTTVEEIDIPKEPPPEFKDDKSPSQRLRSVLYVYWEQNTGKKQPFDVWYSAWVDKKVQEVKETLNP